MTINCDITKKELEEAVKDGRVDIVHILGEDANKVSNDALLEILLNAKEYICIDGEHYGEKNVDFAQLFELEKELDKEYIDNNNLERK